MEEKDPMVENSSRQSHKLLRQSDDFSGTLYIFKLKAQYQMQDLIS